MSPEESKETSKFQENQDSKEEKREPVKWDFGHLTFQCARCGHLEILQHDIEDGIMINLPTTDSHELKMVCSHCNNMMRLFWQKSDKVKEKEETEPDVKEDGNNELQEESKEDKSV